MLRKEILGTKVRTESGLNKPLTLVKPNNDEDYKNQEFLDTDILLAKDIKRFVKGGGANGDSVGVEYIYETSDANAVFTNKLIIDTCPINKDGTYDQTIQLTTRNSEIEFGSIKIGLSEMGFGITVDNNMYITDRFGNKFDYRGPLHAGGSQNQYWTMLTDLSEYKINDGKWDNCIHNDGIFPTNAPFLFCDPNFKEDNSIFRYAYQTDFTNIETDCRNSYRYDVTEKSCIVDSLVVDYNNNGTNTYYNVGGIKSTKQYQSGSKVFATDGSIVDLPVSQKPLFSYIQSTYYEESMAFTEGVYKHFCIYSTQTNHDNICIGAHYYISPSSVFGYTLYAGKHVMWPFYEQKLELNGEYYRYKYDLRNIVGIHSDNSTKIGYYKSDGTIKTIDQLKEEIGSDVQINNTSSITLSQEGKSSTTDLAYSGVTLNQYLTSSTNPGQCRGRIAGGALELVRAYTDASGVTDLSNPNYKINLSTTDASIRGYSKDGHGYVLTRRGQVVTVDGTDTTYNVPLIYLTGDDNNRFFATADSLYVGNFKTTENNNSVRLFVKEFNQSQYKTGIYIQGYSNNNTLPIYAGLFIDTEEGSAARVGVFIKNKTEMDLVTANGGTKHIGIDVAAQSSITELQSQIEALTARVAALEAKQ